MPYLSFVLLCGIKFPKKLKEQLNSTHSDIKYYLNGNGKSGFFKKNYCLYYVTVTLL